MTTTKPREIYAWYEMKETVVDFDFNLKASDGEIKFIEYSAYQALEQENEKLKKLVEMADELMFLDDSPAFSKAYDEYIKAKESAGMG